MQSVLNIALTSSHGMTCPMPMLESVQWQFHTADMADRNTIGLQENGSATLSDRHEPQNGDLTSRDDLIVLDPSQDTQKGETYVAGADGPAILRYELPEHVNQPESITLSLTIRLGPGADVQYRTHVLEFKINVPLVGTCDAKSKMDAAWAGSAHGAGNFSLRSQVLFK